MFDSTSTVLLLDYFRVPYTLRAESFDYDSSLPDGVQAVERLSAAAAGRALFWPKFEHDGQDRGQWRLGGKTLFGRLLLDELNSPWLSALGSEWNPALPICDEAGNTLASVWKDTVGNVFIPFDPDDVIVGLWSERYQSVRERRGAGQIRYALIRAFYRLRPFIPRVAQIWLRRRFARLRARIPFPAWPVETSLHELYGFLLGLLADVAGEAVPTLAPWPRGFDWALVLTHDVETSVGYDRIESICELEARLGYRSSWNLVPERYHSSDDFVQALSRRGFEVGVHGLYHDGRDLESLEMLRRRLPAMRDYADRWGARGFRAPATQRNWDWMPLLGFDYDSSYPDADPFEPQPGGCCTWLPLFNGDLVELPVTLAQDHTLFVILGHADESAWIRKADFLKERGGMALVITHPDYFHHEVLASAYTALLTRYVTDERVWKALPRDVSAWWRRRADSNVRRVDGIWKIEGAAAGEAVISFVETSGILDRHAA